MALQRHTGGMTSRLVGRPELSRMCQESNKGQLEQVRLAWGVKEWGKGREKVEWGREGRTGRRWGGNGQIRPGRGADLAAVVYPESQALS